MAYNFKEIEVNEGTPYQSTSTIITLTCDSCKNEVSSIILPVPLSMINTVDSHVLIFCDKCVQDKVSKRELN